MEFTREVVTDIFRPKVIVCISIPDCFDRLNIKFKFDAIVSLPPSHTINGKSYQCKQVIRMGLWEGIPIIGIQHPSGLHNHDDWGSNCPCPQDNLYFLQYKRVKRKFIHVLATYAPIRHRWLLFLHHRINEVSLKIESYDTLEN